MIEKLLVCVCVRRAYEVKLPNIAVPCTCGQPLKLALSADDIARRVKTLTKDLPI
jgi:hypothetical protein